MTVVIAADEAGALDRAAAAVEQGAVIGVPTDTVYGLVCLCRDAAAIDRLFAVRSVQATRRCRSCWLTQSRSGRLYAARAGQWPRP